MIGFLFKVLYFFTFKPFLFLFWNKTTWFILFLIVLGVIAKISYERLYFSFKREKVGGRRTVLITGGSTGIGFSLAKLFVEDEYNVVLVGRSVEKLEKAKEDLSKLSKLSKLEIITWSYDLSKISSAEEIAERLKEQNIHVDVLVNNAGFGMGGLFVERKECQTPQINCNVTSLVNLTHLLLPSMVAKKGRKQYILNVASLAGFVPWPFVGSVYCATKAFVRSFSKAVAAEMVYHPHVKITCVCPGLVETPLIWSTLEKFAEEKRMEVRKRMWDTEKGQTAEECAFECYRSLMKGELEVVTGLKNHILFKYVLNLIPLRLLFKRVQSTYEFCEKYKIQKKD